MSSAQDALSVPRMRLPGGVTKAGCIERAQHWTSEDSRLRGNNGIGTRE
jgi:hypothetical protein